MDANQETNMGQAIGTQPDFEAAKRAIADFASLNPDFVRKKDYVPMFSLYSVMKQPTFAGLDGFRKRVADLEGIEEWETFRKNPRTGEMLPSTYKAIVGNKSGTEYTVASQQYKVVFDQDVFNPIINAVSKFDQDNMKVYGRFDGEGTGRTVGHLFFNGDDFQFTPSRHDWKESPTMLGIRIHNSYNTELSYGMGFFGIRKICTNYAVYDNLLGTISFRHVGDLKSIEGQFERMIERVLDSVGFLKNKMEDAANRIVLTAEIEDLLWSVNLPKRGIEDIQEHPFQYVPEVKKMADFTALDLYNAATAFITYRPRSAVYQLASQTHAKNAVELLKVDQYDKLLALGKKKREAYEEAKVKAKEKVKEKAEKVAPVVVA